MESGNKMPPGGRFSQQISKEQLELSRMQMQASEAMKKATEVKQVCCSKCGETDLVVTIYAEAFQVKTPALVTHGMAEAKEDIIVRPRIQQLWCPNCQLIVLQKVERESSNPEKLKKRREGKTKNSESVDVKEETTRGGKKIIVPDIEKDMEVIQDEEEKEEEEPLASP